MVGSGHLVRATFSAPFPLGPPPACRGVPEPAATASVGHSLPVPCGFVAVRMQLRCWFGPSMLLRCRFVCDSLLVGSRFAPVWPRVGCGFVPGCFRSPRPHVVGSPQLRGSLWTAGSYSTSGRHSPLPGAAPPRCSLRSLFPGDVVTRRINQSIRGPVPPGPSARWTATESSLKNATSPIFSPLPCTRGRGELLWLPRTGLSSFMASLLSVLGVSRRPPGTRRQ